MQFREEDYNYDRVNDRLTLTAVYSQLEYNITAIQALLFFEIQLNVSNGEMNGGKLTNTLK